MFGRFGWAEILVVVVLVLILFGHNKIPTMMKNLADGVNVFKKELKKTSDKTDSVKKVQGRATKSAANTKSAKKVSAKSGGAKSAGTAKSVKK